MRPAGARARAPMSRWRRYGLWTTSLVVAAVVGTSGLVTRARAHELITNPHATRHLPTRTPADYGMPFEEATVTTSDGLNLVGWFVPSGNGASIILVHGYKDHRGSMLKLADVLHRHGYGLLILSVRAHDGSDGELITFGHAEMKDLEAWYTYESGHAGVNTNEIGIFGGSMGGSLAIQYAARNPRIAAVVADCAFSSLNDTVDTSVKFFTGLPPFPFAPMIVFWTEHEAGFQASEIDAKQWIRHIAPRPIFLLQGGADVVVSRESGQRLFEAAGEPKELWYDAEVGHAQFLDKRPEEFERRVVAFYDKNLRHIQ
jgi:alpha-beta hydrolase superfamily lysophospholipase